MRALITSALACALLAGCGGEKGGSDQDTATDTDSPDGADTTTDVDDPDEGDVADDTDEDAADAPTDGPGTFEVVDSSPDDGDTGVYLDDSVSLTFSAPVDVDTVNATSVSVTAGETELAGRLMVNDRLVMFVPAELVEDTVHTITVASTVQSTSGVALGSDFTASFTTTNTYQDGTEPVDEDLDLFDDEDYLYLVRQVEYVALGGDFDGSGRNEFVVQPLELDPRDPPPTTELLLAQTDTDMGSSRGKEGAPGNLDEDPFEEVAVVSWSLTAGAGALTIVDTDGDTVTVSDVTVDLTIDSEASHRYSYDVALGNVDSEPLDEIVIVGVDEHARTGKLWVLDDVVAGHTQLATMDILGDFDGSTWQGFDAIRVAMGDVSSDPGDEIVVGFVSVGVEGWSYRVISDIHAAYDSLAAHEARCHAASITDTHDWGLDTGDVDGDGLDEVTFGFMELRGQTSPDRCDVTAELAIQDDADAGHAQLAHVPWDGFPFYVTVCEGYFPEKILFGTLDVDDDGMEEVRLMGYVWDMYIPSGHGWLPDYVIPFNAPEGLGAAYASDAGDVDGDGGEDLIYFLTDGSIEAWGYDFEPRFDPETGEPMDPELVWVQKDQRIHPGSGGHATQTLVAANMDADSVVVEPSRVDGPGGEPVLEHEVVFGNDRIIGVLAAAPCGEGIGQNTGGCSTAYGTSTTSGTTLGATVAARIGASVGAEVDVSAGLGVSTTIFSFEFEVSTELEVAGSVAHTHTTTHSVTDVAGYGEDLVLFSSIPYDRYYYDIVSHHESEQEGIRIYTNFPRAPQFFVVSREFYNANNGDQPDIDDSILAHTPTDLSTYLTRAEADDIMLEHETLGEIGPVLVNEGTGEKELEFVIGEEWSGGTEVTLSVDMDMQICASSVCAGLSMGASAGVFAEFSTSNETAFMVSVGSLDGSHFIDHQYEFGMFAYIDEMTDGSGDVIQSFIVLNHYVDLTP